MSLKLLHTADVHIGMKFASRGYDPSVRDQLTQARLGVVQRMVSLANGHGCHLFVVAGDLFDSPRVAKRDIKTAIQALNRFEGLTVLLPGNHDFVQLGEDPIWDTVRQAAGDRVLLLDATQPVDLRPFELDAAVYPGPCTAKHSAQNAIGWVKPNQRIDGIRHHIGIAHGSLAGLSPDLAGEYYPMTREQLNQAGLDLWLLGHTHVRDPDVDRGSEARIFSSSTPEPDGFDCRHPGHAWLVEIDDSSSLRYESLQTGAYRFHDVEYTWPPGQDTDELETTLFSGLSPERDLVKLKLRGSVAAEIYAARHLLVERLQQQVLYLEADLSGLTQRITSAQIDAEFTEGSFPHRLLRELCQPLPPATTESPSVAPQDHATDPATDDETALALQLAYELIQEARQ